MNAFNQKQLFPTALAKLNAGNSNIVLTPTAGRLTLIRTIKQLNIVRFRGKFNSEGVLTRRGRVQLTFPGRAAGGLANNEPHAPVLLFAGFKNRKITCADGD